MTPRITVIIRYTLVLVLLIAVAINASADTNFTVNSTDDAIDTAPGDGFCATDTATCTLRAAIMEANALPGTDTITLPVGLYTLTLNGKNENQALTGDLDITSPIILNGAGAKSTIIRGYDDATLGDGVFDINGAAAVVTISGVAIEKGKQGIRVRNAADVTINASHIRENAGRGLYADGPDAQFSVQASAITHNSGGGVYAYTAVGTIENSTISNNIFPEYEGDGGAIHAWWEAQVIVNNSTIVDNYAYGGGGVFSQSGVVDLSNSIVYYNRGSVLGNNFRGTNRSYGFNIFENDPIASHLSLHETDITNLPPMLGPLADNGGETPTHALLYGSPAISAGNPAALGSSSTACTAEDQIGSPRLRYGCDIGAYQTHFAPYVRRVNSDLEAYAGSLNEKTRTDVPITTLSITFSEPMFDPAGDTDSADVSNPANYALFTSGSDQTFQTESCGVPMDDDAGVTLDTLSYDPAVRTTTLGVNGATPLTPGDYRLLVCVALVGDDGQAFDGNADQITGDTFVRNFTIAPAQTGPTFVVNTLKDQFDGVCGQLHCSLREAVVTANAAPGANTIDLTNTLSGTFVLEIAGANEDNALTGDLDITGNLTIRGMGRDNSTKIDAKNLDRVFHVLGGHRLKLIDLAIVNGNAGTANGGAILSSDAANQLILNSVSATLSKAANGGAIYSAGGTTVKLTDSFLRGTATNNGGALYVVDTGLTLLRSAVQNASAVRGGGAFITGATSQATITASSFTNNQATTAQGGGLYLENGQVRIVNSTVSSNKANNGAGIYLSGGNATFNNLTIAHNTSQNGSGAGIAGGIVQVGGSVTMSNSIVAQNVVKPVGITTTTPADCVGQLISTDYNLFTTLNGCTVTGATSHNLVVSDPLLNSLQGMTNTPAYHSIKLGSPAIAAGNPIEPGGSSDACEVKDILGTPRTDGACDIGAYEENLFPTVLKTNVNGAVTALLTVTEGFHLDQGFTGMQATFGKPMHNPAGDSDPNDVTNVAHYRVVGTGEDNSFESDGCIFSGDDTVITPVSATYNIALRRVDLTFATEITVPSDYRFVICDTVHDISGDLLDGDADGSGGGAFVRNFEIAPPQTGPAFIVNLYDDQVNGYCSIIHCSLREAVTAANAYTGAASIKLEGSTYYVYSPLTIDNPTPGAVITITGRQPWRSTIFGTWDKRLFEVKTPVVMRYLELRDAWSEDGQPGGAVYNESVNLTIENSAILNNSTNNADGGAIYNAPGAGLTLRDVRIDSNHVLGSGNGAGIYNGAGAALAIEDSLITRNQLAESEGNLMVTAAITNAFPADTVGAGIFNAGGTVVIQRSNIHANKGQHGGGLYNQSGTSTVGNTNFYGNIATTGGGGVRAVGGVVVLNNVTLTANIVESTALGAGIMAEDGGVIQFGNTILFDNHKIAQSVEQGDCFSDGGTLQSLGHNFIGTIDNCEVSGDSAGNIIGGTPLLLIPSTLPTYIGREELSVAVDAGNSATCETVDQRGITRPQGLACDIGTYEREPGNGPASPTKFVAQNHETTVNAAVLQWKDNSSDETAFAIERSTDSGETWAEVGRVGANITTYTNYAHVCETAYAYRVRAYNINVGAYSQYTAPASIVKQLCSPNNLVVNFENDLANLSWTDTSPSETAFYIERQDGDSDEWHVVGTTAANQTTFEDSTIACNATYGYRVRAYRASDNQYSIYAFQIGLDTPLCAPADLELTMMVTNNTPGEGDSLSYTLTLSNTGPNTAEGITVKVPLPAALALISSTPAQGSYIPAQNLWAVGSMSANSSTTLTLAARVRGSTYNQSVPFAVEILSSTATDPDSTPNNNVASEDDQASQTVLVGCAPAGIMNVAPNDALGLTIALAAARNETCFPGPDTITLSPGSLYTLTERFNDAYTATQGYIGLPQIIDTIVVEGNGATIERASGESVPYFRFFFVSETGSLTINNLTLRGAHAQDKNTSNRPQSSGAVVYNEGSLTINDSLLTQNYSRRSGMIFNTDGNVVLNNVDMIENISGSNGVVYNESSSEPHPEYGTVTITDSLFAHNQGNRGAAISNQWGKVDVINSIFAENFSTYRADFLNTSYGLVTLRHNTIYNITPHPEQQSDLLIETHVSVVHFYGNVIQNHISLRICHESLQTFYVSEGFNVFNDDTCNLDKPTDQSNTSPLLMPLLENGVDTYRRVPLYSSLALDLIPAAECELAVDERGAARPQGRGCEAGAIEATPVVAPPTNLTVINANENGIEIGWNDNQMGETEYGVERAQLDLLNWTEIARLPADASSFLDTNIECGQIYIYRVRAYFAEGFTEYSNIVDAATAGCMYAAPQNLSATAESQTAIALAWDDVTAENGYRIEWSTDGLEMWTTLGIVGENIGAYADNTLTCGITRHYRVIALYEYTESTASPTASDTADSCEVIPTAPETLTATAQGQTAIVLNWDDVADESSYRVEWSADGVEVESWTTLTTVGADVIEYTDSTLNCETTRHYRVIAINGDAESEPSPTTSATTENCEQPPTIKVVKNGSFEQRRSNNPQLPKSWEGAALRNDKVVCGATAASAAPYVGQCAFRFIGQAGNQAKLKQEISGAAFTVGDTLTLSAYVNRINAKPGGRLWLVVQYKGNTAPKRKTKKLALPAGSSGGYVLAQLEPIVVARPVKFVRITLEYSGKSGKLLIDDVQLNVQKADGLPIDEPPTPVDSLPDMRLSN